MTLYISVRNLAASISILVMSMDMAGVMPGRTWAAVEEGC